MSETKNTPEKKMFRSLYIPVDSGNVYPFIPGTIVEVFVKTGQKVKEGDKLLVLHAMKMNNEICAPISGKIHSVNVKAGQIVTKNDILIEIK